MDDIAMDISHGVTHITICIYIYAYDYICTYSMHMIIYVHIVCMMYVSKVCNFM
jgi:hypothetical protein